MTFFRLYRKIRGLAKGLIYRIIYLNKIKGNNFSIGKGGEILLIGNQARIEFGKNNVIRNNVNIRVTNGSLKIGDNTFINDNCCLVSREIIEIGNNTLIGQNVCIYDNNHLFSGGDLIKNQGFDTQKVIIGDNVWIGSNVVVLQGVTIGNNSVIAAGAIVNENIKENTIYYNKITKVMKSIR